MTPIIDGSKVAPPPLTDDQIYKIAREVCDRPPSRADAIALVRAALAASGVA